MGPELRCRGQNVDGSDCGAPPKLVDPFSGYCHSHDPDREEERRERSRKGGQTTARRFRSRGLTAEDLGPMETPADAQRILHRIAVGVGSREITHGEGQAMTAAVREWLKATDLRLRSENLRALEDQIRELKGKKRMEVVK